jgi:cytochrome c-type biogenesis protein CcmH
MLARTHMALKNYGRAADTLEHVMQMESAQNAQTMVDLAIAILSRDQAPIQGRTASLVESALALEPNNQAALFYSGIAAANRGETDKAAMLWEKLLGLNPPDDVRDIVVRNIAFWRGEEVPEPVAEVSEPASSEPESIPDDAIISARVSLSSEAMSAMTTDKNVFIIARDPNQPSPPIAVTRRRLSELPAVVSMSDSESMVAGRSLSMFAEIELLARVSVSGGPAAASGDWFGSLIVRPAETDSVLLTIDQQVP